MAKVDYYRILGLARGTTTTDIKQRYLILANKYHPDHEGDEALMGLINEAYNVLSDPARRYKYDQILDRKEPSSDLTAVVQTEPPRQSLEGRPDRKELRRPKVKRRIFYAVVSVFAIFIIVVAAQPSAPVASVSQSTDDDQPSTALSSDSSTTPTLNSSTTPADSGLSDSLATTPTTSSPTSSYTPYVTPTPTYTAPVSTNRSCTSNSIGSSSYTNCYGSGGSTSCTTNSIGSSDYTNCYGAGGSTNCTSNYIGTSKYTNCY